MLVGQIGYLYSMITASDQPVPRDAHTRLAQLTAWVERVEGALR